MFEGLLNGALYYGTEMTAMNIFRHGIRLAFENNPYGTNPDVIHPSISESGEYFNGIAPISDPDQGFTIDEDEDWDDWESDDEEDE